ncbi:MAG TPA: hydantoinase/oxoprolinase family protein [Chloroflexota bacterium]
MASILGIDVGGTFTDFVLLGPEGVRVHKRPSTPDDPLRALGDGIVALGQSPSTPVVHGTTIVTNAVLQGRGARTAFVTTRGFADLLVIGRQDRPSLYDLRARPTEPLAPPERCFEVNERIGAPTPAGRQCAVIQPLDMCDIDALAEQLASCGAEAVAICLLFSFLAPEHEQQIADRLRERLPQCFISLSSDVAPEFREYERASTTVIDAFSGPLAAGYLQRLRQVAPSVQLMQSSGGLTSPEAAARHPVCLALSGPAGGVAGAFAVGRATSLRLIGLDMGGTSTDVALCDGSIPMMVEGTLAGRPIRQPMVAVYTIGAGGGSIARLDAGGLLRVGPASAGAEPGPACYGRGSEPTVTDANLLLGRLAPSGLLGGAMPLNSERAAAAVERLGHAALLGVEATAAGIVRVVNAGMARALAHVSVEQGHDPRDFTLVPFGGAGPMHACDLAESLGIASILVPRYPGVLSALGMALSDQTRDYRQSILRPAQRLDDATLTLLFAPLLEQASSEAPAGARLLPALDIRYLGQSFELTVPMADSLAGTLAAFHRLHSRRYGYARPERPVEVVTLRVRSVVASPFVLPEVAPEPGEARQGHCRVWFPHGWTEAEMILRARLAPGDLVAGPALLVQEDATTVVAPGWAGRLDDAGNVLLQRGVRR